MDRPGTAASGRKKSLAGGWQPVKENALNKLLNQRNSKENR